ncbi:hypothetical protein ACFQNE_16230 [Gordonia phosphorivorans]|uniref:DUF4333 domain-containing protein n=1 Tax=Gordonia phosphorivorans TaxID=1056982 RepID=A0ABV6H4X6_9ACTN
MRFDQVPTAEVGAVVQSGSVTCTVPAADTVSCDLGDQGFTLSSSSITARGNDVTNAR